MADRPCTQSLQKHHSSAEGHFSCARGRTVHTYTRDHASGLTRPLHWQGTPVPARTRRAQPTEPSARRLRSPEFAEAPRRRCRWHTDFAPLTWLPPDSATRSRCDRSSCSTRRSRRLPIGARMGPPLREKLRSSYMPVAGGQATCSRPLLSSHFKWPCSS